MAGTRLWVQCTALIELLVITWIAWHVGFCTQRLRLGNGNNGLPKLRTSQDYFQTDPVLCPWNYFRGDDDMTQNTVENVKEQGTTTKSSFETTRTEVHLQTLLVLERTAASQLSHWATVLESEWRVPSYLENLELMRLQKPIAVHILPLWINGTFAETTPSKDSVESLWTHVADQHIIDHDDDKNSCFLIIYIPAQLEADRTIQTKVDQNAEEDATTTIIGSETTPTSPPPVRTYQLEVITHKNGNVLTNHPWIVIPSSNDTQGQLGSLLQTWMVRAITGMERETSNTTSKFWNVLQTQWKEQTVRLHHQILTSFENAHEILSGIELPVNEPSVTDIASLQRSIGEFEDVYEALQTSLLRVTGFKTLPLPTPMKTPERITQDFPLEHYAAVLMPLLFPLWIPFLISTLKEYKRWREHKNKTKDEIATTTTMTTELMIKDKHV